MSNKQGTFLQLQTDMEKTMEGFKERVKKELIEDILQAADFETNLGINIRCVCYKEHSLNAIKIKYAIYLADGRIDYLDLKLNESELLHQSLSELIGEKAREVVQKYLLEKMSMATIENSYLLKNM